MVSTASQSTHFVPTGGLITYKEFLLLCYIGFVHSDILYAMTKPYREVTVSGFGFPFQYLGVLAIRRCMARGQTVAVSGVAWQGRLQVRTPKKKWPFQ